MNRQVKAYYDMAYEYHIAAVTLWYWIMEAPYLYNPISFLLRHTIELQLKALIILELSKSNEKLIIKEIKIPPENRSLDKSHSLLFLWRYYMELCKGKASHIDRKIKADIEIPLKRIDKKDFASTRYRYPFDRAGKSTPIEPVDINLSGIVPDLQDGIPWIIQGADKTGVVSRGSKLIRDTTELFDAG